MGKQTSRFESLPFLTPFFKDASFNVWFCLKPRRIGFFVPFSSVGDTHRGARMQGKEMKRPAPWSNGIQSCCFVFCPQLVCVCRLLFVSTVSLSSLSLFFLFVCFVLPFCGVYLYFVSLYSCMNHQLLLFFRVSQACLSSLLFFHLMFLLLFVV